MNETSNNEEAKKEQLQINPSKKDESVILGIIGAIIGSLAGGALIIFFSSIGFVASLAGLAMAVCTLLLYEKFAGSISKKGIIISVIIMIVMTLLAENLAISLKAAKELKEYGYDLSFIDIFKNLYTYLKDDVLDMSNYLSNLFMVYLFTILGAVGTIVKKFKTIKN